MRGLRNGRVHDHLILFGASHFRCSDRDASSSACDGNKSLNLRIDEAKRGSGIVFVRLWTVLLSVSGGTLVTTEQL
jgi:hypothetical protein